MDEGAVQSGSGGAAQALSQSTGGRASSSEGLGGADVFDMSNMASGDVSKGLLEDLEKMQDSLQ